MSDDGNELIIAINMVEMVNTPEAFERMRAAGPKMCTLTASQPGFLGYQANFQTGVMPMAGRYGGGALDMMESLNPLPLWQYTVWDTQHAHTEFHRNNFSRAFEICAHCFPVLVRGPWEPIYRVVASDMPLVRSPGQIAALAGAAGAEMPMRYAPPGRVVAICEHTVKPGLEAAFEEGARATVEAMAETPGYLGSMMMRQIGVSPWGSLQLDPESMIELVETFGAHPPTAPQPLFEPEQAQLTPAQYLVHSEWETAELAAAGFARALHDREIRKIHNEGVVENLVAGPYTRLFAPMMEQAGWREALLASR